MEFPCHQSLSYIIVTHTVLGVINRDNLKEHRRMGLACKKITAPFLRYQNIPKVSTRRVLCGANHPGTPRDCRSESYGLPSSYCVLQNCSNDLLHILFLNRHSPSLISQTSKVRCTQRKQPVKITH